MDDEPLHFLEGDTAIPRRRNRHQASQNSALSDILPIRRSVDESLAKIDSLIDSLKLEREKIRSTIEKRIEEITLTRYTTAEQRKEELASFLKEPHVIIPKRESEFYVIAQRWLNFQIGWLERQTKSYNIFVVNH